MFPTDRLRRLRRHALLRDLVQETRLSASDLIAPIFVHEQHDDRPIDAMPGQFQWSVAGMIGHLRKLCDKGLQAAILFGVPDHKDAAGSSGTDPHGIIPRAIQAFREAELPLVLFTDVCFCQYTDHGHCGHLTEAGEVANDPTLAMLRDQVLSHAQAGADLVAPSGMMDGAVSTIRQTLDDHGFDQVGIMAYAAKFASAFYGPFREAADSTPAAGDRKSYQMNPANPREALREIELDVQEGADIIMVKPGLPYLDIIRQARDHMALPLAAYNVSGEYAMLMAAAERGMLDLDAAMMESLIAFKRAGCDLILTYFAERALDRLS